MYRLIGSTHSLTGLAGITSDLIRAMDSIRKSIAEDAGLSGSELRAMGQIAESDGITPKQLADAIELSTGSITNITTALIERGLITRDEQSHDRRSVLLSLTASGHLLMQQTFQRFQDAISRAAQPLRGPRELALEHSLATLVKGLR